MMETGINKIVTLARRMVTRVRRSTACDSFMASRLKFYEVSAGDKYSFREQRTRKTSDSFSSIHSCISLIAKSLILSKSLSNLTVAGEEMGARNVWFSAELSISSVEDPSGTRCCRVCPLALGC